MQILHDLPVDFFDFVQRQDTFCFISLVLSNTTIYVNICKHVFHENHFKIINQIEQNNQIQFL